MDKRTKGIISFIGIVQIAAHLFTSSSLSPSDSLPKTIETFPSGKDDIFSASCSGEKALIFLNLPLRLVAPTEKIELDNASSSVLTLLAFSHKSDA